jgi:large subunit ribosomal protein L21
MYVIVEIQGQQFKAEQGKKLFIHHLTQGSYNSGDTVEFNRVLLVDADGAITVGAPTVAGAKVVCEIVSPEVKGDKVLVFHKKRRKGHRKLNGHRQLFSEVIIKDIVV